MVCLEVFCHRLYWSSIFYSLITVRSWLHWQRIIQSFLPIIVLTQQNLNDTVNVVSWRNHLGLSPPWPRFLRLICSNGVIFARMSALRKVLGNGFVSSDRFWLCFTLCCQSISLDRQNALDSLNWILVLKHHRQKKQSLALINGHFNPWSKY